MDYFYVYPARHYVIPSHTRARAIESIREELDQRLPELGLLESHRLQQRTLFDLEMIEETGSCKGIENYSRHFDFRQPGEKPYCLLDYFPKDFMMVIDESHQTIPQVHGMYKGDRSRKASLIDYGFRLPSAYDNRPLKWEEFREYLQAGDLRLGHPRRVRAGGSRTGSPSRSSGRRGSWTRRSRSGRSRARPST